MGHFIAERWGIEGRAIQVFDAGARPMGRPLALAILWIGLMALGSSLYVLFKRGVRIWSPLQARVMNAAW